MSGLGFAGYIMIRTFDRFEPPRDPDDEISKQAKKTDGLSLWPWQWQVVALIMGGLGIYLLPTAQNLDPSAELAVAAVIYYVVVLRIL
ncbi:MAG: hypothetical protein AAFY82_00230 [Pseudomonadota bacterium]